MSLFDTGADVDPCVGDGQAVELTFTPRGTLSVRRIRAAQQSDLRVMITINADHDHGAYCPAKRTQPICLDEAAVSFWAEGL